MKLLETLTELSKAIQIFKPNEEKRKLKLEKRRLKLNKKKPKFSFQALKNKLKFDKKTKRLKKRYNQS